MMKPLTQLLWGLGMFGLGIGAVENWGWSIDRALLHIITLSVFVTALILQWRAVKRTKKKQRQR